MKRILTLLPPALVDEIDAYQARRKLPTQAEAIRQLLQAALDASKPTPRAPGLPKDLQEALQVVGLELGATDQADTIRRLLRIAASADAAPAEDPEPTKLKKRGTKLLGLF